MEALRACSSLAGVIPTERMEKSALRVRRRMEVEGDPRVEVLVRVVEWPEKEGDDDEEIGPMRAKSGNASEGCLEDVGAL